MRFALLKLASRLVFQPKHVVKRLLQYFIYYYNLMKYRIVSDTHFMHNLLIEIWDRKVWYERKLLNNLMSIPEWDILIHLWDICIWHDKEVHEKYIKPLRCKKILVKWNHDKKSNNRYTQRWRDFVCDSMTLDVFGKEVLLKHIPWEETLEWVNRYERRVVVHWHRHTFKRFDRWIYPFNKHKLYSCEIENMQPRTIEHMIHSK
jgi:calcineurin-like phosphoesterase family protein